MARDLQDQEERGSLRRRKKREDVGGPKVEQEEMEGEGEEEEQYLWVVRRDGGVGGEEEEEEETSRVINGVGDGDKPSRSSVVPITSSSATTTQTIFMTNRPSPAMTDHLLEATNGDLQLSTVTEVTESSTTSEPSFSDESMDPNKLSTLDGKLLHYVNKANKTMEEKGVKQHSDDFFEQRFDQLSKLHDLYASVSSISAKSQSHLEEREMQRQQLHREGGGTWQRGSTYSLGALVQNSRDAADPASSSTSDLNSLCSEPVKMPDYADFLASRAGSVRSGLADVGLELLRRGDPNSISLSDLGFFQPVPKEQKPQSDLNASQTSLPLPPPPPSAQEGEVGRSIVDRSDSPVLEGIDQELAKYAKLKDLKQAYNGEEEARKQGREGREKSLLPPPPPPSDTSATLPVSSSTDRLPSPPSPLLPEPPFSPSSGLRRDHVPDGASNPDLNHKVALSSCSVAGTKPPPPPPPVRASSQQQQHLLTPDEHHVGDLGKRRQPHPSGSTTSSSTGSSSTGHHHHPPIPLRCAAVAPRRSPGTGQSSCSSDPEEILPLPPQLPSSIMMAPSKAASRVSSSSSLVKPHRSHHHFYHQEKASPPSASSSDGERRTATVGKKPHQKLSSTSSSSTSSASKADPVSIPSVSAATRNANDDAKRQEGRNRASSTDPIPSNTTVPKDKNPPSSSSPSKAKVPRFSRLFASATRKISRSPLKIGKAAEGDKKKSVTAPSSSSSKPLRTAAASDSRKQREEDKKKGFLSSSQQQQQQRRHPPPAASSTSSHHPDKEGSPSIVGVTPGKKSGPLLSPSSPSATATAAGYPSPKNAKGTSSSKASSSRAHHHHVSSQVENNRKQEQQINSDDTCLQAGKNNNKRSSSKKGAHSTTTLSSATLPFSSTTSPHYTANVLASPYSFPSAPTARRSRGDTSSNDSGLGGGCGGEAMMKGRQQGVVRMRQGGRGASSKASPSQQHRRKSNKHCRSSGYESSAADSLDSPISNAAIANNLQPASEEPESSSSSNNEQLTLCKELGTLPPLCLVRYEDEDVGRMDVRWRQEQVLLIRHEQERLKAEMDAAKSRINSDPGRWSYELHVENSKREKKPSSEEEEEAFVEAFAKETQILSKRVDACKAHVELVTCFDVDTGKSTSERSCTTECEFAQDIVLEKGDRTETELF